MTNSINQTATVMVFNNSEFGNIRISLDGKGEPLFCGKDVCEVLGVSQNRRCCKPTC